MYHEAPRGTIIIEQVANGWLVKFPFEEEDGTYGLMPDNQIRHQARIMKDEMLGDEELKKLQGKKKPESIFKQKNERTYTFQNLPDTLNFIHKKYKEEITEAKK